MEFLTTTSTISDQFVGALCNTLMHSLWQGLILSAIAGGIILSTKKSSSAMRYNLLIAALVLFTLTFGVTFAIQFNHANVADVNVEGTVINSNLSSIIAQPYASIENTTISTRVWDYLNAHHNTIVLIWFLIICAKSIQLVVGMLGIRRLKRVGISLVDEYWTSKMQQLATQLKIKETVTVLESSLAKVPMVIGNLKPIILIPIGLLTALSTEEVEAILVHELAHIKRRDYLVNLLQSLVEIVFFFNPAVLWVSQLIKTERENCCDDLALVQSSSKVNYIRALVSCNEYQLAVPAYAVAFPGSKGNLLDRVKRLASNRNHSLNLFEKTVLAICLVASGLFLSAFSEKERIKDIADTVATVIHNIQANKTEDKNLEETTAIKEERNTISKKTKSNKLDIFHPNDNDSITNVSASNTVNNFSFNTGTHLNLGSACLPPLAVQLAALNAKTDIKLNSTMSLKSSIKINNGTADSSLKTYNYKYNASTNAWYDYKPNRKDYNKTYPDTTKRIKVNATPTPMPSPMKINHQAINVSTNVQTKVDTNVKTKVDATVNTNVIYDLTGPSSMKYTNTADKNTKYIAKKIDMSGRRTVSYSVNTYETDSTKHFNPGLKLSPLNLKLHIPKMADALYNAGLIKDKTKFTARITNDELVVNGVKQSEENHQKILKLYQKKPDDKVNYSFTYPGN